MSRVRHAHAHGHARRGKRERGLATSAERATPCIIHAIIIIGCMHACAACMACRREYGNRMYGLPGYFLSRWMVELPSRIILPFISCVIVYWMIGYQVRHARAHARVQPPQACRHAWVDGRGGG